MRTTLDIDEDVLSTPGSKADVPYDGTMVRFVFFDYDGVLTTDSTGSLTTCRYLSKATGIGVEQVRAAFAAHNRDLTLGRSTHEQVWPQICKQLGRTLPFDLLQEAFDATPMNRRMFDMARQLRAVCGIGIITDNKADRMRRLRIVQHLELLFEPIVVSAEVGCSKEGDAIFKYAIAAAQVDAAECVFIDNDRLNVGTAEAVGMRGIYFDDQLNDVKRLAERLHREFGFPELIADAG
jgi:putative hydrolase of the HAD superfamily